jgi:hypothetical protein
LSDLFRERFVARGLDELLLRLAGLRDEFVDHLGDFDADLPAEFDRFDHHGFGDLIRTGLDHDDRIRVCGDGQVELVLLREELRPRRVDDELVVTQSDPARAECRRVRHRTQCDRRERRDRRKDVGLVLLVGRENLREDLDLAFESVGEQRPDRPVDDPTAEDLLRRRAAFALEEATGEAASGGRLLAVLDGQREEVDVVALLRALRGSEHHRVAVAHHAGAVGELGHAAGFERQQAAADLAFDADRAPCDAGVGVLLRRRAPRGRRRALARM